MITNGNSLKSSVAMGRFPKKCLGLNLFIPSCMYFKNKVTEIFNALRHEYGYRTTSMDFRYTPSMDFNEVGGFAFLGVILPQITACPNFST